MLEDEEVREDLKLRAFFEDLKQVGPFSKQILNYSYPPLLYQRGDDEEEEGDEDNDEEDVNKMLGH